jgi:N-acyl-D-amino-acid deacylase
MRCGPETGGGDSGVMLCPGFVDMHAHSALEPFRDPRLTPKAAQGFTTELINPKPAGPETSSWSTRRPPMPM